MYNLAIITLSDRAAQGVYEDKSGKYLYKMLKEEYNIVMYEIIPDDKFLFEELLVEAKDKADLVITTGGTGLSSKDITVDIIENIMDYEVRGMSIALHQYSLEKSKGAMFSRALCVVSDNVLIITMPGSEKAVKELCSLFKPHIKHGLDHLNNIEVH